jgi:glyoxylase-like metal-dependent hydrolase (beta-lactamase superfamily II)
LAGVLGTVTASLGAPTFRARSAHAQPRATVAALPLSDDLHVLTVGGSNALALTGVDGVVLVDGAHERDSDALLEAVARLPRSGAVHTLFNTHWHPEQTGSNERLARTGAAIIAHENTRLWTTTDVTWPWDGTTFAPLPKIAQPNRTFYDRDELEVGARTIHYGHLRHAAHTDGDLYVSFPEENVLAVGGAVCGSGWPLIDWATGGWIGGIVGGLELLLALTNAQTRVVPAQGGVLGRADLEEQFAMYSTVYERLSRLLNSGRSPDEAVESVPTVEFDAKMGDPSAFIKRAFESMWGYLSPDA